MKPLSILLLLVLTVSPVYATDTYVKPEKEKFCISKFLKHVVFAPVYFVKDYITEVQEVSYCQLKYGSR